MGGAPWCEKCEEYHDTELYVVEGKKIALCERCAEQYIDEGLIGEGQL